MKQITLNQFKELISGLTDNQLANCWIVGNGNRICIRHYNNLPGGLIPKMIIIDENIPGNR